MAFSLLCDETFALQCNDLQYQFNIKETREIETQRNRQHSCCSEMARHQIAGLNLICKFFELF